MTDKELLGPVAQVPPVQIKSGKHLSAFLNEASKAGVTHLNFDAVQPADGPLIHEDTKPR